jgi:hypothetical protein
MKTLEEFAQASTTSGQIRWEPYLEKAIDGYMESKSILRQLCYIYRLNGTYTANIPRNYATGNAVEIVEGMEIPSVRQVLSTVDVKVSANGTAIEISDESKMLDWYGDLAARELEEALKRMLRKENTDIINTLSGASAIDAETDTSGSLAFEDILDLKVKMEGTPYWAEPKVLLVGPTDYATLVKDAQFVDYSQSNTTDPLRKGTVGGQIAGIDLVQIPEITDYAYMMDMSQNPLWLVLLQDIQAEAFRIPDQRKEKVQITQYQKPAVLKPNAIGKLDITH